MKLQLPSMATLLRDRPTEQQDEGPDTTKAMDELIEYLDKMNSITRPPRNFSRELEKHTEEIGEQYIYNLYIALNIASQVDQLSGPDLISAVSYATRSHSNSSLAAISGLTPPTIAALKAGKNPSPAQKNALLFAVIKAGKEIE